MLQRADTRSVSLSLCVGQLEGDVSVSEGKLTDAYDEIAALKAQLASRNTAIATLRREHEQLAATNNTNVNAVRSLTIENDLLGLQLAVDGDNHVRTEAALSGLHQELAETKVDLELAEEDIREHKLDLADAREEIVTLNGQMTRSREKYTVLDNAHAESARALHTLEAQLEVVTRSKEEECESLRGQLAEGTALGQKKTEAAAKRIADLSNSHCSLQGRYKSLEAELDEALRERAEVEGQRTEAILERHIIGKALKVEVLFRKEISATADRQVGAANAETKKAQDALVELAGKLRSERAKNEMLRDDCARREADVNERDEVHRAAQAQIAGLLAEVAQAKSDASRQDSAPAPAAIPDPRVPELQRTISRLEKEMEMFAEQSVVLKEMLRCQADAEIEARERAKREMEELRASFCSRAADDSCPPTPSLEPSSPTLSVLESPVPATPALEVGHVAEIAGCSSVLPESATVAQMPTESAGLGLSFLWGSRKRNKKTVD